MKMMKAMLLVGLVSLIAAPGAMAVELTAGTIMISGDSSFNLGSTKISYDGGGDETITEFGLDVMAGYFIMDNLEVDLIFGFGYDKEKNGSESTTTDFTLGGGAHYYFGIGSDVLFPYAGGYLAYTRSSTEVDSYYGTSDYTLSGIEFGVRGGVKYFLNEHFAVDGGAKLAFGKGTYSNGSDVDFDATIFELFAGIAVVL